MEPVEPQLCRKTLARDWPVYKQNHRIVKVGRERQDHLIQPSTQQNQDTVLQSVV